MKFLLRDKMPMIKAWITFLVVILSTQLISCGSTPSGIMENPVEVPEYSEEDYRIGVGDTIRIAVWGNDKLSLEVPVRPDGKISMSLIGDVLAADNTTDSLAELITQKYLDYIKNPKVTVIVTNPSSSDFQNRIRVTGAVMNPQSVPYRKGMTVLDLVLQAGGPNEFALPNKAKLYRRVGGEVKVYSIYLDDILKAGRLETNYMLVPSDIVTVPERSF